MSKLFFKVVIGLFLTGLSFQSFSQIIDKDTTVAKYVLTSSYEAAIFPDTYKLKGISNRFTPSRVDVEKAEKLLSRDLGKLNTDHTNQDPLRPIHRRLLSYKKQYFGYINQDGEKILLVNAFIKTNPAAASGEWLNKMIYNPIGGTDFWQVSYNVDTNLLFDFMISNSPSVDEPAVMD